MTTRAKLVRANLEKKRGSSLEMSTASTEQARQARRNAIIGVVGVAVFAALFLMAVTILDSLPVGRVGDDIEVATSEMPTEPMYVLLIGSDSRKGTALYTGKSNEHAQVDQHSDIMTLMRIDPRTYAITFVTVPRDTVTPGGTAKINDSLLDNDPDKVVEAVEQLTGVDVARYMMVNFTTFADLIDALGGIDVDVPKTITVPDPATGKNLTVNAGKQRHLNGAQSLVLARARKDYDSDQDALRQMNVRAVETAMVKRVLSFDGDLDIDWLLEILEKEVETDLDLPITGMVILDFVQHADEVTFYSCTGPYEGAERQSDGLWVVRRNDMAWAELMAAVDAGEDPSGIVELPKF